LLPRREDVFGSLTLEFGLGGGADRMHIHGAGYKKIEKIGEHMAQEGIPLGEWSGSNATRQLAETIKRLEKENAEQQTRMLRWTIAAALFAGGALVVSFFSLLVSILPWLGVGHYAG